MESSFQVCLKGFDSMLNPRSPFLKLMQGAAAGLIATIPMTLFMRFAWRQLPTNEQYALPPRQITRNFFGPWRFWRMSRGKQAALTLALHFLFGAATGSLYGILEDKVPVQASIKGLLAGMVVWAGSYLGWVPMLDVMPPATRQPWRRNVMMIVAHLIWGLVLSVFAREMSLKKTYITIQ
jgi:uncharacterized membrane protein YagU involved in acid resistance